MASSYAQRWSDPPPGQSRRRGGAMLLAILAHVLVILLLLRLAPLPADHERSGDALKTFEVAQGRKEEVAKQAEKKPKQVARAAKPSRPVSRQTLRHAATTGADASAIWALGRGIYRSSDIAAMPSAKQGETETADAGGGGDSAGTPGAGPGGRTLYNAEWYTEPTDAEMRTYLPHNLTSASWAMIACQSAPRYRVENCRELQESPPGSGLSRALRQAAWQFKVMPPRINGKQVMGAWIRICFDFEKEGVCTRH